MGFFQTLDGMLSKVYADYMKLVKYLAVGIVGTVADLSIYSLIIVFTLIDYSLATALAYSVGTVINFTLNRRFTFNGKYKKVHYQFVSFVAIALIGLGLQEALMYVLVHHVLADTSVDLFLIMTRMSAIFVGFMWTYLANKKITFKVFR